MQTIPKKKIVILIISTIAYALLFTIVVFWITKAKTDFEKVPFGNLFLWKIIAAFFSLYALERPWGWKKRFKSMSAKQKLTPKRVNSFLMLFCYTPFVAPLVYGCVLVFFGISFSEYLIFFGASVLDVLVWGTYNLRTSFRNETNIAN